MWGLDLWPQQSEAGSHSHSNTKFSLINECGIPSSRSVAFAASCCINLWIRACSSSHLLARSWVTHRGRYKIRNLKWPGSSLLVESFYSMFGPHDLLAEL